MSESSRADKESDDGLLPCPHCGWRAVFETVEGDPDKNPNVGGMYVECVNELCGATTRLIFPLKDDVRRELSEIWNRRSALSAGVSMMVTRGDGVPLPDQAAALQEFKTQARLGHLFKLLQAIVDSDNKQSRCANADMLAADLAAELRTHSAIKGRDD